MFRLEDDTASAASVRGSCQLRALSGVPDLERGQSRVFLGGGYLYFTALLLDKPWSHVSVVPSPKYFYRVMPTKTL